AALKEAESFFVASFNKLTVAQDFELRKSVREAGGARGSYSVKAILPPDVIGLFVLLPRVG
ncbi:MAG: hypothetical protein HUU21_38660, partial [Polyangiaceae bacterium]|nr:hypothetical protein [Polyangiaceae bacterium]